MPQLFRLSSPHSSTTKISCDWFWFGFVILRAVLCNYIILFQPLKPLHFNKSLVLSRILC